MVEQHVLAQWHRFLQGIPVGNLVRKAILESWERSAETGIDPIADPLTFRRIPDGELQSRLQANEELIEVTLPHLRWATTLLEPVKHVAYLVDHDGIVLSSVGNAPQLMQQFRCSPGSDWSEQIMGTNGAGTSLMTNYGSGMIGPEHFRQPIHTECGVVYRVIGIAEDFSAMKKTDEELEASLDALRSLSQRLEAVREEERRRIAREVHDELGGRLTCLKLDLSRLAAVVQGGVQLKAGEMAQDKIQSMFQLIDQMVTLVQDIAHELRPDVLDRLGLVAAVEWLAQDFESRTDIPCFFRSTEEMIQLDPVRATAMFRICQEALTNVARHAAASSVRVRLTATREHLQIEIEDDGRGISADKITSPRSFGLLGMRERVAALGGEIFIKGSSGKGTIVRVALPQ